MVEEKLEGLIKMLRQLSVDQLDEVCNRLKIQVAENKKGKKTSLLNSVIRYLSSDDLEDSDDGGLAIFQQLENEMTVMLEEDDKREVKGNMKGDARDASGMAVEAKTRIEFHKLREFKITGGSVGEGTGAIDYMGLSYQMAEGKSQGYTSKEIMSGVVKAIKAGSSLRRYLESKTDLAEDNFIKILRSHYNVKDSTTLFNEMAGAAQEPCETEMNFVFRMMDLRNNILTLSKEEGCSFNKTLVRKKFYHALAVGFKKNTIRLELQSFLKNTEWEDEDLLKEVSLVVARENEQEKKVKSKGAGVNALESRKDAAAGGGTAEDKTTILSEIKQLSARVSELSALNLKKEICDLKKQMAVVSGNCQSQSQYQSGMQGSRAVQDANQMQRNRRPFIKCEACQKTNAFCRHCSMCGSSEHKRNQCSKNA